MPKTKNYVDRQWIGSYFNPRDTIRFELVRTTDYSNISSFVSANGIKPEKAYSAKRTTQGLGWINDVTTTGAAGKYFVDYEPDLALFQSQLNDLKSQAAAKLQNKVIDQRVGLGEAFLEAQKTYNSVADIVHTTGKFLKAIKRRDLIGALQVVYKYGVNLHVNVQGKRRVTVPRFVQRRNVYNRKGKVVRKDGDVTEVTHEISSNWEDKGIADRFLETRFCLAPLLNDAVESAKMLFDSETETPSERSARKAAGWFKCTSGDPVGSSLMRTALVGNSPLSFRVETTCETTVQCRGHIKVTNPALAANKQLGIGDPFVLAYELTYASWLVDYFVNLGDVIKSLTAYQGVAWLQGSYSIKRKFTCRYIYIGNPKNVCVPCSKTIESFDRVVSTVPITPGLRWNGPSELSDIRMATALAFLTTQLIGFSKK